MVDVDDLRPRGLDPGRLPPSRRAADELDGVRADALPRAQPAFAIPVEEKSRDRRFGRVAMRRMPISVTAPPIAQHGAASEG